MDFPFPIMLLVTLVASLGFALFFNVNKRRIIPATLGGVFTWAIYYVLSLYIEGIFIPVVIASIFAAVFAETMSRITHTPVTGFFIISVIPLIPGRALYYTMYNHVICGWHSRWYLRRHRRGADLGRMGCRQGKAHCEDGEEADAPQGLRAYNGRVDYALAYPLTSLRWERSCTSPSHNTRRLPS